MEGEGEMEKEEERRKREKKVRAGEARTRALVVSEDGATTYWTNSPRPQGFF